MPSYGVGRKAVNTATTATTTTSSSSGGNTKRSMNNNSNNNNNNQTRRQQQAKQFYYDLEERGNNNNKNTSNFEKEDTSSASLTENDMMMMLDDNNNEKQKNSSSRPPTMKIIISISISSSSSSSSSSSNNIRIGLSWIVMNPNLNFDHPHHHQQEQQRLVRLKSTEFQPLSNQQRSYINTNNRNSSSNSSSFYLEKELTLFLKDIIHQNLLDEKLNHHDLLLKKKREEICGGFNKNKNNSGKENNNNDNDDDGDDDDEQEQERMLNDIEFSDYITEEKVPKIQVEWIVDNNNDGDANNRTNANNSSAFKTLISGTIRSLSSREFPITNDKNNTNDDDDDNDEIQYQYQNLLELPSSVKIHQILENDKNNDFIHKEVVVERVQLSNNIVQSINKIRNENNNNDDDEQLLPTSSSSTIQEELFLLENQMKKHLLLAHHDENTNNNNNNTPTLFIQRIPSSFNYSAAARSSLTSLFAQFDIEEENASLLTLSFPQNNNIPASKPKTVENDVNVNDDSEKQQSSSSPSLINFFKFKFTLKSSSTLLAPTNFIFEQHPYWFASKLFIPPSTTIGLQISCLESHPGAHQELGKSKEGFSLFSFLTNNTSCVARGDGGNVNFDFFASITKNGRNKMRSWFASPTNDVHILKQRHDAVEFLTHPENREIFESVSFAVHRFYRDPVLTLRRIAAGQNTTTKDWQALVHCCGGLIQLVRVNQHILQRANNNNNNNYQQHQQQASSSSSPLMTSFPFLEQICSNFIDFNKVQMLEQLISSVVDFSATMTSNNNNNNNNNNNKNIAPTSTINTFDSSTSIRIKQGVDATLDEFRSTYASLDNFLAVVARKEGDDLYQAFLNGNKNDAANNNNNNKSENQNENNDNDGNYGDANNNNQDRLSKLNNNNDLPLSVSFIPQTGFLLAVPVNPTLNKLGGFASPLLLAKNYQLVMMTNSNNNNNMSSSSSSSSGGIAYFKNPTMLELDENVGDLHAACIKAEADVKRMLEEQVLVLGESLVAATNSVAELECLCCFAMKTIEEGWTRPELLLLSASSENTNNDHHDLNGYLQVRNCRHPLLSKLLETASINNTNNTNNNNNNNIHHHQPQLLIPCPFFEIGYRRIAYKNQIVKNATNENTYEEDLFLSDDGNKKTKNDIINKNKNENNNTTKHLRETKSTIITGMNGSGKSILAKSLGLTIFLSSIGCFVPCDECKIGVFDAIYTNDVVVSSLSSSSSSSSDHNNINNNTSKNQNQLQPAILRSSFGQEVSQVADFLSACTSSSLFILDEFGSGTVAEDGMSLLGGILSYCSSLDDENHDEKSNVNNNEGRPTLIVCTHFSELLDNNNNNNNNNQRSINQVSSSLLPAETTYHWLTMSARLISSSSSASSSLQNQQQHEIFLFVPVPGSLFSSARTVLKIARNSGMPLSVIEDIDEELKMKV